MAQTWRMCVRAWSSMRTRTHATRTVPAAHAHLPPGRACPSCAGPLCSWRLHGGGWAGRKTLAPIAGVGAARVTRERKHDPGGATRCNCSPCCSSAGGGQAWPPRTRQLLLRLGARRARPPPGSVHALHDLVCACPGQGQARVRGSRGMRSLARPDEAQQLLCACMSMCQCARTDTSPTPLIPAAAAHAACPPRRPAHSRGGRSLSCAAGAAARMDACMRGLPAGLGRGTP